MQAVDEAVSKRITTQPDHVPEKDKVDFQPTSTKGVSFPRDDLEPIIVVTFETPAEVHSVKIPRDKTPDANVEQFRVTFITPNGTKVSEVTSSPSPKNDKTKPAEVDSSKTPSDTPVSRVEITILHTTNGESPKGVILDIVACTNASIGKCSFIAESLPC